MVLPWPEILINFCKTDQRARQNGKLKDQMGRSEQKGKQK